MDKSAYFNLAKIFAKRCLECGIIEMDNGISTEDPTTKVTAFQCCECELCPILFFSLGWKFCKNNGGRGNIIKRA